MSLRVAKAYAAAQLIAARRVELGDLGIEVIDASKKNRHEQADMRIIVDVFRFVLDNASASQPVAVALISGDSDFGYCLSVLRAHGHRVIIFVPDSATESLRIHAHIVYPFSSCVQRPVLPFVIRDDAAEAGPAALAPAALAQHSPAALVLDFAAAAAAAATAAGAAGAEHDGDGDDDESDAALPGPPSARYMQMRSIDDLLSVVRELPQPVTIAALCAAVAFKYPALARGGADAVAQLADQAVAAGALTRDADASYRVPFVRVPAGGQPPGMLPMLRTLHAMADSTCAPVLMSALGIELTRKHAPLFGKGHTRVVVDAAVACGWASLEPINAAHPTVHCACLTPLGLMTLRAMEEAEAQSTAVALFSPRGLASPAAAAADAVASAEAAAAAAFAATPAARADSQAELDAMLCDTIYDLLRTAAAPVLFSQIGLSMRRQFGSLVPKGAVGKLVERLRARGLVDVTGSMGTLAARALQ